VGGLGEERGRAIDKIAREARNRVNRTLRGCTRSIERVARNPHPDPLPAYRARGKEREAPGVPGEGERARGSRSAGRGGKSARLPAYRARGKEREAPGVPGEGERARGSRSAGRGGKSARLPECRARGKEREAPGVPGEGERARGSRSAGRGGKSARLPECRARGKEREAPGAPGEAGSSAASPQEAGYSTRSMEWVARNPHPDPLPAYRARGYYGGPGEGEDAVIRPVGRIVRRAGRTCRRRRGAGGECRVR